MATNDPTICYDAHPSDYFQPRTRSNTFRFKSKRLFLSALCALALAPLTGVSAAEWAPTKPIRLVVPYGPGGSSDFIARLIAKEMSDTLGQQVVVENKDGGSGAIAMQDVARSAPDGHTIVLGHVGVLAVNPSMFAKLPYDPDRDFVPVTHLVNVPMIFVVNSQVPAKNLKDFVSILINTKLLGSTQWLANRMNDFAAILHDSPPADPAKPVLVPGEIELAKMARQRKEGIAIGADVLALLRKHAANALA